MNHYIANLGGISIRIKQIGRSWYAFHIDGGTCLYSGRTHAQLWERIEGVAA